MVPTTYADIVSLSAAHARGDRAAQMPLLGFLTGLVLAVGLWSVIGWLAPGSRSTEAPHPGGSMTTDVNRRVLPGFGLSLGYTVLYMSLLVLIPLTACFLKASALDLDQFVAAVWTPRARAAYGLTIGASFAQPSPTCRSDC
jgi:hypothetical protein